MSLTSEKSVHEILGSYDDKAALAEAATISGRFYVDRRIAELETQNVFSKTWQVIGRTDQVEKPGDFVTLTWQGSRLSRCAEPMECCARSTTSAVIMRRRW